MELVKMKIADIVPYENNPRYNDDAVDAVKESIKQVDYCQPIVVDENNVILSGHTRHQALYQLGRDVVDVIVVKGLTEEQKKKYRLLDNKTAEIADWNLDMLVAELDGLDFGDLSLFEKEMTKAADKILKEHETGEKKNKEDKVIICPRCGKPINSLVDPEEYDEPELSYEEYEEEQQ